MIFSKKSQQPSRHIRQSYKEKKRSLTMHFCSLVRMRNPGYLMHWAIVGTMAMFHAGVPIKQYQNPMMKSFSASLRTSFKYLDAIYKSTSGARMMVLRGLPYCAHGSDNYNCLHGFSIGRDNKAAIAHIGMIFNVTQMKEYIKPNGSIYRDNYGQLWCVVSSNMSNPRQCVVDLKLVSQIRCCNVYITRQVTMPNIEWEIVSLHGEPVMPRLTYVDQPIVSSLHQFVPRNMSNCELILGDRSTWTGKPQERIDPRKYVDLVQASRELKDFLCYLKSEILSKKKMDGNIATLDKILKAYEEGVEVMDTREWKEEFDQLIAEFDETAYQNGEYN